MPTTKLTLFVVNKDEWYTKGGTQRRGRNKSMKNVLYVQWYGMEKGTSQAEATSNSKKIRPVALDIVECYTSLKASGRQGGT